jgi:hypothetical protein
MQRTKTSSLATYDKLTVMRCHEMGFIGCADGCNSYLDALLLLECLDLSLFFFPFEVSAFDNLMGTGELRTSSVSSADEEVSSSS